MYRTSKKKVTPPTTRTSSFNICGIEGFMVLFLALSLPLILAVLMSSTGPSKVEKALAQTPFDLKGFTVSCDYAMDYERKCLIGKSDDTFGKPVTIAVTSSPFPTTFYVYTDESGVNQVRTSFDGELLDLATARARLSNEVHAVIAEYLAREKTRGAPDEYRPLSDAEKARNLASYE